VKTYSCTNLGIFLFVLVSKVVLEFNWVFKIRAHKMFFIFSEADLLPTITIRLVA
jgi:hypothetical protein